MTNDQKLLIVTALLVAGFLVGHLSRPRKAEIVLSIEPGDCEWQLVDGREPWERDTWRPGKAVHYE